MASAPSESAPLLRDVSSSRSIPRSRATSQAPKRSGLLLQKVPILYIAGFSVFLYSLATGLPTTTILGKYSWFPRGLVSVAPNFVLFYIFRDPQGVVVSVLVCHQRSRLYPKRWVAHARRVVSTPNSPRSRVLVHPGRHNPERQSRSWS